MRRLVWGDESLFSRYLGFYVACSVIDNFFDTEKMFVGHLEPNLQASVYSIGRDKLATFFAFRSDKLDAHTREEQKALLAKRLDGLGWVIPQLLEGTKQADDFFFDAASQIQLDTWYQDRVTLVGDACQCLTLLAGQGASMGMAGAYLLADELHKADGDYKVAFPAYQQRLNPRSTASKKKRAAWQVRLCPGIIWKLPWPISCSTPLCSRDSVLCLPGRLERRP